MSDPTPGEPPIWFIGGPPVGSGVFDAVRTRLGRGEMVELLDPASPGDGWAERGAFLARKAAMGPPPVVVAHGLALPAVLAAGDVFAATCFLNGPVTRVDPITAVWARLARVAPWSLRDGLLRPQVLVAWLASSAGLRRMVVNPYVMDRDTVVALAMSRVETAAGRAAVVGYLRSLSGPLPEVSPRSSPSLVLWGDDDVLYPSSEADFLAVRTGSARFVRVGGGRFLHVVERPWDAADRIAVFLSETLRHAATTTRMSRSPSKVSAGAPGRAAK
jgi:hypothetical protein